MRRLITITTLIALAATLIAPALVWAAGPPAGKGPGATPPGLEKRSSEGRPGGGAAKQDRARAAEAAEAEGDEADGAVDRAERRSEKAERKAERARGAAAGSGAGLSAAEDTSTPEPGAPDADAPAGPAKETGIANALSRIMRNIERAEARVAAGEKSQVPPGLLRVMAKFMGWLGIEADPAPDTDGPGDGDGSQEETGTVGPYDPSDEETGTVGPDDGLIGGGE